MILDILANRQIHKMANAESRRIQQSRDRDTGGAGTAAAASLSVSAEEMAAQVQEQAATQALAGGSDSGPRRAGAGFGAWRKLPPPHDRARGQCHRGRKRGRHTGHPGHSRHAQPLSAASATLLLPFPSVGAIAAHALAFASNAHTRTHTTPSQLQAFSPYGGGGGGSVLGMMLP